MQGLSPKMIEWRVIFQYTNLLQGSATIFDYRTATNPFVEQYGDDWETFISKTEACRNKVSINRLIDHIFIETGDFFKGTSHEKD